MKTIAEVIAEHQPYVQSNGVFCLNCLRAGVEPMALFDSIADHAAHVAQAIRESRVVWTVEELDALPIGVVVGAVDSLTDYAPGDGGIYQRQMTYYPENEGERWVVWAYFGDKYEYTTSEVAKDLPLRVLWTPEDEQ